MYAQGTNAAMDDFMGEMKCQLYVHIQKMVEKAVKGKVFFRRDIFKEKITEEEESQSLLANNVYD